MFGSGALCMHYRNPSSSERFGSRLQMKILLSNLLVFRRSFERSTNIEMG